MVTVYKYHSVLPLVFSVYYEYRIPNQRGVRDRRGKHQGVHLPDRGYHHVGLIPQRRQDLQGFPPPGHHPQVWFGEIVV